MTKELIWAVLALALILTTYLSHMEDRRHKEAMAKLEARKLEVQTRMRELDKAKEQRDREFKAKLAELDRSLHLLQTGEEVRRGDRAAEETPAETRETLRRVHATNTRVERGNR